VWCNERAVPTSRGVLSAVREVVGGGQGGVESRRRRVSARQSRMCVVTRQIEFHRNRGGKLLRGGADDPASRDGPGPPRIHLGMLGIVMKTTAAVCSEFSKREKQTSRPWSDTIAMGGAEHVHNRGRRYGNLDEGPGRHLRGRRREAFFSTITVAARAGLEMWARSCVDDGQERGSDWRRRRRDSRTTRTRRRAVPTTLSYDGASCRAT